MTGKGTARLPPVRRLLLPVLLLALAGGAGFAAMRSDRDARPEPFLVSAPGPGVGTALLSARRIPGLISEPAAEEALSQQLAAAASDLPPDSCLLADHQGRLLFQQNPSTTLTPASTIKLVTAAAALELLGPDAIFTTTVRASDALDDGVVEGDLWLVGGGDPVLATDDYLEAYDVTPIDTDLEALADQLVAGGLTEIRGAVVGDESRFDTERYVAIWPDRYAEQNQTGPLSALTVNDAFADFPSEEPVRPFSTAADSPATHAAATFDDLLEARGVAISGAPAAGIADASSIEVGHIDSPRLASILSDMLTNSDNATAELVLKEIGVRSGGAGTTAAGAAAVGAWLQQTYQTDATTVVADGSGLAVEDHVGCDLLLAILDDAAPGSPIADGLAVAGERGTLEGRYVDTDIEGRLRAKTGSLRDSTALAGFVDVPTGSVLTFAMIANRDNIDFASEAVPWQDAVVEALAAFPSGVDLEAIGPLPVPGGAAEAAAAAPEAAEPPG